MAQCQHAAKNLETHGAFLVEDVEHLKKEGFDCDIKNSDSSTRVIDIRKDKANDPCISRFLAAC